MPRSVALTKRPRAARSRAGVHAPSKARGAALRPPKSAARPRPGSLVPASILLGASLILLTVGGYLWLDHTLPSSQEIAMAASGPIGDTAMMRTRVQEALAKKRALKLRQSWVELPQIAPQAVAALIASEDARFFEHGGIDYREIHAALRADLQQGKLARGASTLTQQVAKNLWLSEDKSLLRKAKELVLSNRLEAALEKERILAIYLNIAEWGDGVFGIEAAARAHLRKSASELDLAESAALVAMLPSPRKLSPRERPADLHRRALRVLARMESEGFARTADVESAREKLSRWLGRAE